MSDRPGHVVRIERNFAASAEDVFDAWTSPEVMRRWFHCAAHWETPAAEVDLRVGGKVRVVMRKPDGTEVEARGEYTLIELSFTESEGSTTVLLVNSGISTDARRDAQDWGWHGCLDQLERALGRS